MRKTLFLLGLVLTMVGIISTGVRSATVAQDSDPQPIEVHQDNICQAMPTFPGCDTASEEIQSEDVLVLASGDQSAQTEEVNQQQSSCMITGRATNIRLAPSTVNTGIWGSLSYTVPSLGSILGSDGYTWFQIAEGYVRGDVVGRSPECGAIVVPVPAPVQAPTVEEPQSQGQSAQQQNQPQPLQNPPPSNDQPVLPTDEPRNQIPEQPTEVPTEQPVQHERRDAATYGQIDEEGHVYVAFSTGETVVGAYILYGDGQTTSGYVSSAPQDGRVYGGVVWPWETEIP